MRTRQLTILLIAASFLALPLVAAAGHKNYGYNSWPDQYARIAVKQSQKNYQIGCGFHGNRWTSNYNDHRRWAARKPAREGEKEIQRRDDMLQHCGQRSRGYGYDNNHSGSYQQPQYYAVAQDSRAAFADYYASTAVRQAQRNIRQGCGYYGERWTTDYNRHYRYAYKTRQYRAESEIQVRDRLLDECRGGGRRH